MAKLVTRTTVRMEDDFWWKDLVLEGNRVTWTQGRHGTTVGKTKIRRHKSVAAAKAAFDEEVNRFSPGGFTVRSRRNEEVVPNAPIVLPSAFQPEFAKACLDDPSDPQHWRVYADWLQAQGDVRGELAALGAAGKATEASALFAANLKPLLGELERCWPDQICALEELHGFVIGATLRAPEEDDGDPVKLDDLTGQFLALPIAWAVTRLRFGLTSLDQDNDWTSTVAELVKAPQRTRLARLEFNDFDDEDSELSWVELGDFSAIWGGLPSLEYLHLKGGGGGELGEIEHTRLKTFIRESGGLSAAELGAITSAQWPQLERLDVWTGDATYGAAATPQLLQPLLDAAGLPKLRHLGIINSEVLPELLSPLLRSKVLPQLEVLDLSRGVLADEDVETLLAHRPKLVHLKRLDLSENLIESRGPELQKAFPNVSVLAQRDFEDERYVAVGE